MEILLSLSAIVLFFTIYAVIHSFLASLAVKNWLSRVFGAGVERWYRLAYNFLAVVTLLPLLPMLALLPDQTLYIVPAPWRWLMAGGQLLALAGLGITFWQTKPWHFLGLAQLLTQQKSDDNGPLVVHGFYRWVRHPLYFFSLLLLWLTPAMTTNLLVAYILFTLYFYIGSIYEERRLRTQFGASYDDYRQRVPRLIPRPGRRIAKS